MIRIKNNQTVALDRRIPTLHQWRKSVRCAWRYWSAKKKQRGKHRITTKSLTFGGCKSSHFNNSMRHWRICFISAALESPHWGLQFPLFQYLSYCCIGVCARGLQLHAAWWLNPDAWHWTLLPVHLRNVLCNQGRPYFNNVFEQNDDLLIIFTKNKFAFSSLTRNKIWKRYLQICEFWRNDRNDFEIHYDYIRVRNYFENDTNILNNNENFHVLSQWYE